MRTYETLYIVRSELDDDAIQTVAKEVETLITENDGAIVRSEIWGKRRLAYEVQDCTEGCYILLRFQAEPVFIPKLENHFRLTESIIRYLVKNFSEQELRLEILQQTRNEEELRASAVSRVRDLDGDRNAGSDSLDNGEPIAVAAIEENSTEDED